MALEDALGATDPQADLLNFVGQRAPELAQNGVVDPQTVVNRLIRKQQDALAKNKQRKEAPSNDSDPASYGRGSAAALDDPSQYGLTGEGQPPRPNDQPEEAQAAPGTERPSTLSAEDAATGGTPPEEAAAPAAAAPTETKATPAKEAPTERTAAPKATREKIGSAPSVFARSAVEAVPQMAGGALKGAATVPAPPPTVEEAAAGEAAAPGFGGPSSIPEAANDYARAHQPKASESGIYKLGQAIQDKTKLVSDAEREAHPIAAGVGSGIGAAGPLILAGLINPPAAIAGGAALFGLSSAGDTYAHAIQGGASEQTARDVAQLSGLANAALGSLPIASVLAPFAKYMTEGAGWGVKILAQAAENGITFATVGEAQEYIGKELAKAYNSKAGYDLPFTTKEATERVISNFMAGAILGAGHAGFDTLKNRGADTDTGTRRRPSPDDFQTTWSRRKRDRWESRAAYYGEHSPDDIAKMSDEDLDKYVHEKDAQDAGRDTANQRGAGAGNYGSSETRASDDEILKRWFTDEQVANFTPEQKEVLIKEAEGRGTKTGAAEAGPGTRERPIDLKSADDVKRAGDLVNENYSHAQGEANNTQRVHVVWNGMEATLEAGAGGVRKGIAPDGKPYDQRFPDAHGYFKGATGADGDGLDAYFGQHPTAPTVYVIDELDRDTGKFKQHKVFAGFQTPSDALQAYAGTEGKRPSQIGGMRAFSIDKFREWRKGDLSKPVSDAIYNVSGGQEPTGAPPPKTGGEKGSPGVSQEPPEIHVTAAHREAIEKALRENGIARNFVRPRVIAHAAEIHAREGFDPKTAFQVAFARDAVADGLMTPEQVKEHFGEEVAAALSPRGASKPRPEARGAGTGGSAPAAPAAATERVPGGEEARRPEAAEGTGKPGRAEAGEGAVRGAAGGQRPAESTPREPRQRPEAAPRKSQTSPKASTAPLIGEPVEKIGDHWVTAADGTRVKVRPVVVEAADLITSADEGYDAALQPRQREGRAAAKAQEREIATKLDPERLGHSAEADRGAPIVGPDKQVESGNGRTNAIRKVYSVMGGSGSNAKKYRDWLTAQGVDVSKYKEPILVRQRVSDLDEAERRNFVVAANQAATLSMSAPERAMADAGHITPDMLDQIRDSDLGSLENRRFVRSFVGSLPASERGNLTSADGGLSAEGLARVRNAILAKAYGDADILARVTESTDDDIKSISNALTIAAPAWAKMRGEVDAGRVPQEMDITTDLLEAVKRTADIRSKGTKIDNYLAQQDAFDHFKNDVDALISTFYDPRTRRALAAPKIADFLQFYAREASKVSAEAGLDLGLPKVTLRHGIQAAFAKTKGAGARPGAETPRDENRPTPSGKGGAGNGGERVRAGGGFAEPESKYGAEPGAEGRPQLVLTGAEQRSSAELARRRVAEPLKPKVAQKPLEGGLFGDQRNQLDLLSQPPTKQERAPAASPEAKKVSEAAPTKTPLEALTAAGWSEYARDPRPGLTFYSNPRLPGQNITVRGDGKWLHNVDTAKGLISQGANTKSLLDHLADLRSKTPAAPPPAPQDAFPDKVAPPAPPPQITEKPKKAGQTSLFDWETPDERPRTGKSGSKALGQVAPGEGRRPQAGGNLPGGGTRGGRPGAGGNRAANEPGLFDFGGQGSGAPGAHPPTTGGPAGGRRAGGGVAGNGARVPKESAPRVPDVKPEQAPSVPALNYRITDETELGKGSEGVKFRDNIAAIETLKKIETEDRRPTPAEQRILARYVGWGGLANAFRQPGTNEFKPDWKERGETLEPLLNKEELRAAQHSTTAAHYTSKAIVDAAWKIAERLGFKGGLALESSMGTGNFLGLIPEHLAGQTHFIGVELDSITARIAKALYPQETVLHSGFQKVPLPDGEFVLSIGNPPFGTESLRFQHKPELYGQSIHNQFFLASLDALRPGGLHIAVVSHHLLDAATSSARAKMAAKAKLLGAVRLPDTAFKENARTEVVTDLVVMQRRTPEEEKEIQDLIDATQTPGKSKQAADARAVATRQLRDKVPWLDTDEVRDPLGGEPMPINSYFVTHPDMVVGRLERSGTMHVGRDGKKEVNVKLEKPEQFQDLLDKAVERLPKDKLDLDKEIVDRTLKRFETLSDSIKIALRGLEPGHLEFSDKGELTQISERETANGDFEPTKRVVTPDTPWSRQLMMDNQGRWFTLEPKLDAKGAKVKVQPGSTRNVYERKYFPNNEVSQGLKLGAARFERVSDLTRLRDALRRQIELETQDAPAKAMEANRGRLAAAYRGYTDKNGLLHDPANMRLLNEMPDGPLLMSLESGYRPAITNTKAARTGGKARKASAKPASILSKRAILKYEPPEKASSPADALAISLSERGYIDVPRVAKLLGIPEDKVGEALSAGDKPLAFYDPELQRWEARNDYLSGQVRRKLAAARGAGLEKNVKELEAVQPEEWTADQVSPLMASNWIPPKVYEDFAKHLLGVDRATVNYAKTTNAYNLLTSEYSEGKLAEWGTPDMPPDAIIRGILNSRLPKVMEPTYDSDGHRVGEHVDKEKTALVALKAREIEQAFADWVYKDGDRRRELVKIYNDKMNTRTPRQHDGRHLTLPGKNPDISLRRHIYNAIWRGIYERNMLVDHVVGAGKTFTAIGRIMERRRMGLSRKPMIAVPNHLVEQWASEAMRLYPGAKVLAAGKNQFDKQNRRRLFARIATGDWDMVIVPHSSFEFIKISPDTEMRFLEDELRRAQEAVADAEATSEGGGRFKPYTVKEAERLVSKIEARMDGLRGSRHDNMLTFEQMGVDDLTVDEAHEFKNLFYSSRMTGVRGMGDKTGSQKAFDLYNKVRVLNESPTGTTVFLTGTPISNSAVEMYTMMRYLAAKDLRELGMEHFDSFRSQFVSAEPQWEPTEAGGLKEVTRLGRSWSNMRALMDLYHSFTDSVTQEDINRWYAEDNNGADFPIPKVAGGGMQTHVVKPTEAQVQTLGDIIAGFEHLDEIKDPDQRNAERLRLMDRARKVSLDVRAVDSTNPSKEEGGKLEALSNEVARIYKKWNADKGTQLIFLDRSVPKAKGDARIIKKYDELIEKRKAALAANDEDAYRRVNDQLDKFDKNEIAELRRAQQGGWNAYDQIKKNLIARGVPADEIRFMQEANNDAEKKEMIDSVNAGEVRVLIGSTQRMGAGMNAQERLVGGIHGDVTWKPSDIEQRRGRWIRQGNKLYDKYGKDFEVEEHNFVTERTVDAKMWDLNAQKLRMINGIRKYDGAFNMDFADEDAVSMAEIAALASGDPLLMERVKLSGEIEKLEMQERGFQRKMAGIEDAIDRAKRAIADYPAQIAATRAAADDMQARRDAVMAEAGKRRITVEGKEYQFPESAALAAQASIDTQKGGDDNAKYKINIDGADLTNKEAIQSAFNNAFGDREPFALKVGGETFTRRWTAAKELTPKVIEAPDGGIKLGRMLGADLEAEIASGDKSTQFVLGLTDNGKTVASSGVHNVEKDLLVDAGAFTRAIEKALYEIDGDTRSVASSRGDWMQERINAAEKALPDLEPQLNQASPHAVKLAELRAKLRGTIETLDARTRAAATYTPGVKAEGLEAGDKLKREWAENSPIKTVDDLFAKAEANQTELATVAEPLAQTDGVEFHNPGVKSRERTQQKIDKGKAPGRINDVVRAGFSVETPDQANAVVKELAKHFEIVDEGWAVTKGGYFDRKVLVRFKNGQVGEIQLWHPAVLHAKEHGNGHKLYVESSKLPADHPRQAEIAAEMRGIYEAAMLTADPEWKALLGSAGNPENILSNASLDITRPFDSTSGSLSRVQDLPSYETQASLSEQTKGSPSQTPYVRETDTSASTENIGLSEGGRNYPESLYHVAGRDYEEGEPLRSLYDQLGNEAYDRFAERWPEAGELAQVHAHRTLFFENLDEARDFADNFGGRVLRVDPAQIDELHQDTHEFKAGVWATKHPVSASALSEVRPGEFAEPQTNPSMLAERRDIPVDPNQAPFEWKHPPRPARGEPAAGDLGHFYFDPKRPIGEQAQDYILRQGIATGLEHLLAVDEAGKAVLHLRGEKKHVALDDGMLAKLADPKQRIVAIHNHPGNGPLSEADWSMLGYPGAEAIWALGHGGNITRGALTDLGRSLMSRDPKTNAAALGVLASRTGSAFARPMLTPLVERGLLAPHVADKMHYFLIGEIMRRVGIVHFHTTNEYRDEIKDLGLEPHIQQAVTAVRRAIPNGVAPARILPGDDRSSGTVFRHPGEVGATFGRRAPAPAERPQPRVATRTSGGNGRAQAPPEQLRLLEPAEEYGSGLEAPRTQYGPQQPPTGTPPGGPASHTGAMRGALERAVNLLDEIKLQTAPMAVGSDEARAAAKDYANAARLAKYEWSREDDDLKRNFTLAQQEKMWNAGDEENNLRQMGIARRPPGLGLDRLTPQERATVDRLVNQANDVFRQAQNVGIIESEGMAYYVPRMVVLIDQEGNVNRPGAGTTATSEGVGRNFHTSTPQMKQRKYKTVSETEAAAKKHFGENAIVARNIRSLPLATSKLQEAVAARTLINHIKEIGNLAGREAVAEGRVPEATGWFTLNHPAFRTWRPEMRPMTALETAPFPPEGRSAPRLDEDGNPIFQQVPIYVRNDFKGPLSAVLSRDNGKIYNALMAIKGKSMVAIMYSPVIHNLVEWSRSLPAAPLKVASTMIYWQGNRAKNDLPTMREAIQAGLVPIGKRFFNQDITSIMEEPNLAPGRSTTAKVLGFLPGLFSKNAGEATKRAIDKAGDVWHNKLLWDRVADLQMGLYVNFRDHLVHKGYDPLTAQRMAAHFGNRYAGALPIESMSAKSRKFANIVLFSRSFTMGNLGAMKDMLTGLPKDVLAQIERDSGAQARRKATTFGRRKAITIVLLDIALNLITTSILQDVFKKLRGDETWTDLGADYAKRWMKLVEHAKQHPFETMTHPMHALWSLSSVASNEPRKREGSEARVLLFRDQHGRMIYGRNPLGKIGEEFYAWPTAPGDMFLRKLSQFVRGPMQALLNDKYAGSGFDRPTKIWRPDPEGWDWVKNGGRIVAHLMGAFVPIDALASATDFFFGNKDDWRVDVAKATAPLAGISISKGHPGGPGKAEQDYKAEQKRFDTQFEDKKHKPPYQRPWAAGLQ